MEFSREFLDKFDIRGRLGEGGMGRVLLAQQRGLERLVAIKFMATQSFSEGETRARLEREALTLARLKHPNILEIYDTGQEHGMLYLVLEYLEGESIRERLERDRQIDEGTAVRIACNVARGLGYSHSNGVLHRDVKPENVLLGPDGQVKLVDFGLARVGEGRSNLTLRGVLVGTPAYLAPEMVLGNPPSPLTDLYAVGVLLYEMLAGRPPHPESSDVAALIARTKTDPGPLPATIDTAISRVVFRCLARDPGGRYSGCEELVAALEAVGGATGPERPSRRARILSQTRPATVITTVPAPRSGGVTRAESAGLRAQEQGPVGGSTAQSPGLVRPPSRGRGAAANPRRRFPTMAAVGACVVFMAAAAVWMRGPAKDADVLELSVSMGLEAAVVRWGSRVPYVGQVQASSNAGDSVTAVETAATGSHQVRLGPFLPSRLYALQIGTPSGWTVASGRYQIPDRMLIPAPLQGRPRGPDRLEVTLSLPIPLTIRTSLTKSATGTTVKAPKGPLTRPTLELVGPEVLLDGSRLELELVGVDGASVTQSLEVRTSLQALGAALGTPTFARMPSEIHRLLDEGHATPRGNTRSTEALASLFEESSGLGPVVAHLQALSELLARGNVPPRRLMAVADLFRETSCLLRLWERGNAPGFASASKSPGPCLAAVLGARKSLSVFAPATSVAAPDDAAPAGVVDVARLAPGNRTLLPSGPGMEMVAQAIRKIAEGYTCREMFRFDLDTRVLPPGHRRIRLGFTGKGFGDFLTLRVVLDGLHTFDIPGVGDVAKANVFDAILAPNTDKVRDSVFPHQHLWVDLPADLLTPGVHRVDVRLRPLVVALAKNSTLYPAAIHAVWMKALTP